MVYSHLAGVKYNDTANAPGVSISIYLSGCEFNCPNCHNKEAQDFDYGEPLTEEKISEIFHHVNDNGVHRPISILGGEPMHPRNVDTTMELVFNANLANTQVYIWTGYTLAQLSARGEKEKAVSFILNNADYIIDGPYIEAQRDITLKMRGSKNQIIWHRLTADKWEAIE